MATVAQLAVDLIANTASFQNDMRRAAVTAGRNLDTIKKHSGALNDSLRTVKHTVVSMAAGFAAFEALQLGRSLIDAQREFQKIHYTLLAVTGSSQGAAKEFQFLIKTSRELGLALEPTAQGYARMAASAKGSQTSVAQLHKEFKSLSEAFLVLHTSGDEVNRLLIQLDQAFSLGKIQMRDLRAMAQSFPGVYEDVAEAFKNSGKSMQQWLAEGGIPIDEFMRRWTARLHDKYGPYVAETLKGINASLNTLSTAWFQFRATITAGGFESLVGGSARGLAATLDAIRQNLDKVKLGIEAVAAVIAAKLVGALSKSAAGWIANTLEVIRYQNALRRMAGVSAVAAVRMTTMATAGRALRGVMAFLGGSAGVVFLAVTAILALGNAFKTGVAKANEYAEAVGRAADNVAKLGRAGTTLAIQKGVEAAHEYEKRIAGMRTRLQPKTRTYTDIFGNEQSVTRPDYRGRRRLKRGRKLRNGSVN